MASSSMLSGILEDSGFKAIAAAVRNATVSAQALKAMKRPDYRDIRYELLHDLRRKRSLPGTAPLAETVSEFISSYNFENARRREMGKHSHRNVTTAEFAAFVRLLDQVGRDLPYPTAFRAFCGAEQHSTRCYQEVLGRSWPQQIGFGSDDPISYFGAASCETDVTARR